MLIAVMCVFEEEELLPRAVESLRRGGVDTVHVFDGAWEGFGVGPSGDATVETADRLGCVVHERHTVWANQETKRTRMFHEVDAEDGDHLLVFDADEELEGVFPPLAFGQHYNLMVRCVGPNDMPGIRGEWPNGDYYAGYKPEMRVFAYEPELHCKWPGGYWDSEGRIEPYADHLGNSLLPVLDGVSFLHHGNDRTPERRARKIDFYGLEGVRRRRVQHETFLKEPW